MPSARARIGLAVGAAFLALPASSAGQERRGPPPSHRDVELRVRVSGTPEEALAAWLDEATVDRFFGVASRIEPRVGGAYEIRFLPGDDAWSQANSTEGARILALEPGRHLAFEWSLPPWAEEPARSAPPTRVDIRTELPGDPAAGGATVLRVRHSGFGEGAAWEEVRAFFQRSWFEILTRFRAIQEEAFEAERTSRPRLGGWSRGAWKGPGGGAPRRDPAGPRQVSEGPQPG